MKNRALLNGFFLACILTAVICGSLSAGVNLNVDGTLTRSFTLDPGGKTRGEIVVQNAGDEESEVKIFLQDYLHYADGRALFQKTGTVGRSNASWITLTPNQAVIPAKGSLTINFTKKGQSSGKIDGSSHRIYPGCSARFVLDLSKLAPGGYKAVVVADNGDDNVFGANYVLELK